VRKRIAIGVMGLLLLGGGAGAALGAPSKSGLGPPNAHGLCTAAANGKKTGWGNLNLTVPPPFRSFALQGESLELQNEHQPGDARLDILLYCANHLVVVGGNPQVLKS
jgi:hypothetical protein